MAWWGWVLIVIIMVIVGAWAWTYAARIDRLHRRIASARFGLDRHLVRRNAEALRIADFLTLPLDDQEKVKAAAARALAAAEYPLAPDNLGGLATTQMGTAAVSERRSAESALSRALREALTPEIREAFAADPLGAVQLQALDDTAYRVALARTLHNQDVKQVQRLRSLPWVRLLHLSGRAPWPEYVDIDDQL